MPVITCVDDLKAIYRRRVPRMFYDYAESGSYTESTFRDNTADFQRIKLRQRVAVDMTNRSTRSTMIGEAVAMPVALAPVGMTGMQAADGEIKAARAAKAFGVPFTLSTMSICSIEDVAAATRSPFWFQLYLLRDRGFSASLIERAKAARCSALILTVDAPLLGRRYKDVRNGLSTPPQFWRPRVALDLMRHPAWCLGMLRTRRRTFGNIIGHAPGVKDLSTLTNWKNLEVDPALSWQDVEWVMRQWGGPLILKGLMDPQDIAQAARLGVAAVVVSNHGGRQLDGAPATVEVLPRAVEAARSVSAAGQTGPEVWVDSGIRSGQDVLKMLALGAQATLVGRPWLYGLAAQGRTGVDRCLQILAEDLELTMALCGCTSVDRISPALLMPGTHPV